MFVQFVDMGQKAAQSGGHVRVLTRILKTGFIESVPRKSWSQN